NVRRVKVAFVEVRPLQRGWAHVSHDMKPRTRTRIPSLMETKEKEREREQALVPADAAPRTGADGRPCRQEASGAPASTDISTTHAHAAEDTPSHQNKTRIIKHAHYYIELI